MPAASPALNSASNSRVNCSTSSCSSEASDITFPFSVVDQGRQDQVVDHVPGELFVERPAYGHLPEQLGLDHLVRDAGQRFLGPGRHLAARGRAPDDR